jgi:hypothetical protein
VGYLVGRIANSPPNSPPNSPLNSLLNSLLKQNGRPGELDGRFSVFPSDFLRAPGSMKCALPANTGSPDFSDLWCIPHQEHGSNRYVKNEHTAEELIKLMLNEMNSKHMF